MSTISLTIAELSNNFHIWKNCPKVKFFFIGDSICIIPLLDVLTEMPILGQLTGGQILSTVVVFIMAGLAVAGMNVKKDTKTRIGWDTGAIFAVGLTGFVLLYFIR